MIKEIKKLKFTELANILEKEFSSLNVGDSVLTLNEITQKYNVSLSTAKRSILELQQRDVIYSQPGKGSFIAPPARKKVILFVFSLNNDLKNNDFFNTNVLVRSLTRCNSYNSSYTISAIDFYDFEKNYQQLDKVYPNVKGVVFLRYIEKYIEKVTYLIDRKIPCFFYGSSVYKKLLKNLDYMVYNEEKIVHKAFEEIAKSKKNSPAIIGDFAFVVYEARLNYFKKYVKEFKMSFSNNLIISEKDLKSYNSLEMRKFLCNCDSIIAVDGPLAIFIAKKIREFGFNTPKDIVLISINNENFMNFVESEISSIALDCGDDINIMFDSIIDRIENNVRFKKETTSNFIKRSTN